MDALLLALLLTAAIISSTLAIFVWRHRSVPGGKAFAFLMLAVAGWALSYTLHISSPNPLETFWLKFSFVSAVSIPTLWLILSLLYTNPQLHLKTWHILLLSVEPLALLFLIWTNDAYHLFWRGLPGLTITGHEVQASSYGAAFWVHVAYSYVSLLSGSLILVDAIRRSPRLYRGQVWALLAGAFAPWAGNLLYLVGNRMAAGLDLTPVLFAFTSPFLAWGLYRYRFLDAAPVGYHAIIENILDGVLVLDQSLRVIAFNPAASLLINLPDRTIIGMHAEDALAGWPELLTRLLEKNEAQYEFVHPLNGAGHHYEVRISPLYSKNHLIQGWMVLCHDISQLKETEQNLRQTLAETETLYRVSRTLSSSEDLPVLLQTIANEAANLLEAYRVLLVTLDLERKGISHTISAGPGQDQMVNPTYPDLMQGMTGWVIQNGRPAISMNGKKDGRETEEAHQKRVEMNIGCIMVVPLLYHSRLLGIMLASNLPDKPNFTPRDIALFSTLANQAAASVESSRLFADAERRATEAETLSQATAAVISTLDQEEAIERILVELERVVPYDSASVQLLQDGCLEIVGGRGWRNPEGVLGQRFPVPGSNPNTLVIQEKQPLIVHNVPGKYPVFQEPSHAHILSWLGAPLTVHDQVIGMLSLDSTHPDHFDEHHARLVLTFADQVAIAIENARLYSDLQLRVDESDALRATIADISAELELPNLLEAILQRAAILLQASGGDLGLFDNGKQVIEIVHSYNLGKDYKGIYMAVGEGAMGYVAETLQPLMVDDYSHWERRSLQYSDRTWYAVLAAPMLIGGRLLGVISIVDDEPSRRFTASDLRLLTLFSQQAAIAVENARLYHSAKESAERRAVLYQASQDVVAASLDPEGIYKALHQAASQLMTTEAFVLTLFNEVEGMIDAVYVWDHSGRSPYQQIPSDHNSLSSYVISNGQSVFIANVPRELEDPHSVVSRSITVGDDEDVHSILAVPMRLGGKVIGMLSAQSYKTDDYSPDDMKLLEMLASFAAIALDNARLFKEVQQLAIIDPLLEIFNRRHLFDVGQREFNRARRFGRNLAVIMLDIDHFKQINDRYGHATGDVALQIMAHRLQQTLREVDIVGRYGGEEFIVILPETDLPAAVRVAERLRAEVSKPMPVPGKGAISITVSIGVTCLSPSTQELGDLIEIADAAQYEAKNGGRNRIFAR